MEYARQNRYFVENRAYYVAQEYAVDIDTSIDLKFAEALLNEEK